VIIVIILTMTVSKRQQQHLNDLLIWT